MTHNDNDGFWSSGAFLRLSDGQILVFKGPFQPVPELEADLGRQDYFGEREQWLKASKRELLGGPAFQARLEPELGPRVLGAIDFSAPDAVGFENSFRLIQGKIQRGEIEKAVPIVKTFSAKAPERSDLCHGIFHLLKLPQSLRVFGFWHEGRGVLGATPEVLFELHGSTLQTMALAGSVPRDESSVRIPLLRDPKEMKEHQLVVDDIVQKLKPLGWLRQEPTVEVELPTLRHLLTKIEVSGVVKTPKELIRQMHPTAALGVAPRGYGFQWMKELPDQRERGLFGAPIFFRTEADRSQCLVAIRSLFWDERGSQIFAGCGIVAASQLEREWNEILAKTKSIFSALGLNS